MNERKLLVYAMGGYRGVQRKLALLGTIAWEGRRGLVWRFSNTRLRRCLRGRVDDRIQKGEYYVAAAVRSGNRVSAVRLERIRAQVPEVLRCMHADKRLWSRGCAGHRLTAAYKESALPLHESAASQR